MFSLKGKKGLVIGIANEKSIAWGCAKAFHQAGAELAVTYLNDKAKPYVQPLANQVNAALCMPLDVTNPAQLDALFQEITAKWGKLDFLLHSIAYAPKEDLHGRVVDCSLEGFQEAMDISCHSFIRLAKHAEPLMQEGGSLLTVTYYGSTHVVENYNMMGPVKAALESSVRYMASELGNTHIRVNALSPGPLPTRAAFGLPDFEAMLAAAKEKSAGHSLVGIEEIGAYAAFLTSDAARHITGNVLYIDAGLHMEGI